MILVTGGSGLVGRELITQLLAKGKTVRAIYNKTAIEGITHTNLHLFQCDILDVIRLEEAMENVQELYHSAGHISYFPKDAHRLYKINVEGTANIVNAALNAGVKKIVHVSSIAALGKPANENELIDETMDWNISGHKTNYGKSKYLGELEIWRGIAEGLNAVIVNPSLILGPGNWSEGSTAVFKSVYDESPWFTDGMNGFVDVRDVAKAMIQLMESEITAQRFIVSAENETFSNVFHLIAKAFNKKIPNRKVTPLLAAIVWRIEAIKSKLTGIKPLITRETAASAMAISKYDNNKLKKYLPSFSYYPLEETIAFTCAALQQKLNNR
ncbi:MAG: NAD-dependent epimerase/dehydratase family protein [Bacteroidetes bacterium]|nr:NAD-dependent epimerase/dehydratase family protein [Bacteroidota bacterium]